mmetsp:Transcript_82406/g.191408  ORF Transcript_82406/g.191408 Transcript_82406/m.191408 type:complete len:190 (-) Transcript_82406:54-623(-)
MEPASGDRVWQGDLEASTPACKESLMSAATGSSLQLNGKAWPEACRCTGCTRRTIAPTVTTLAVLNIPARYTQEQLLSLWVPDGSFDFFHLPFGRCYAIMNFTSNRAAAAFVARWQGGMCTEESNGLDIFPASVQGYAAQLERIGLGILAPTQDSNALPAIFRGTMRLDARCELLRVCSRDRFFEHPTR